MAELFINHAKFRPIADRKIIVMLYIRRLWEYSVDPFRMGAADNRIIVWFPTYFYGNIFIIRNTVTQYSTLIPAAVVLHLVDDAVKKCGR
ncbi:MAG: hypothetical protein DSY90_08300 [Deltaproteobacteria bacterium]|nr:MAG: hypothetical protein DSY90_08300 [Deltaproteobacteria bacterium]RUA01823.1 MAG: hypothetical protein DSY89_03945 [Deltaproteobacteria bacterium]